MEISENLQEKLCGFGQGQLRVWDEVKDRKAKIILSISNNSTTGSIAKIKEIYPAAEQVGKNDRMAVIYDIQLNADRLNDLADLNEVYRIQWSHDQRAK
jgi:hypothetical protein